MRSAKARHTTVKDINAAEKAKLAIMLRKQGYTLDEIALQIGYSDRSGAFRAIKRELDRVPATDAKDLRKLEEMRLDDMLKGIYGKAQEGDTWSIDRVIALSKRRSEITGMDVRPDEQVANQNYTKRIILTHETGEPQNASS